MKGTRGPGEASTARGSSCRRGSCSPPGAADAGWACCHLLPKTRSGSHSRRRSGAARRAPSAGAPSGFHHAPGRGESHGVTRHGLRSRLAGKRSRLTGQGQQAGASGGLGNRKASSPRPLSSTKDHESCCLLCRGHQAAQSSVCGTRHASLGPWGRRVRDVPSAWRSPPSRGSLCTCL